MDSARDVISRMFELAGKGDAEGMNALIAEDVVLHQPGRSLLAGDYKGREAVAKYRQRVSSLTDGTLTPELHELLGEGETWWRCSGFPRSVRAENSRGMRQASITFVRASSLRLGSFRRISMPSTSSGHSARPRGIQGFVGGGPCATLRSSSFLVSREALRRSCSKCDRGFESRLLWRSDSNREIPG